MAQAHRHSRHATCWRSRPSRCDTVRLEVKAAALNAVHLYFNSANTLSFSSSFLAAFGAQHQLLGGFVHGVKHGDERLLRQSWNAYHRAVGDSPEACAHLDAAFCASGATVTDQPLPGMNCVLFALGDDIGAPPQGAPLSPTSSALYSALSGAITQGETGQNQARMTPFWRELLPDLGYSKTEHGVPGDIVVYTLLAAEGELGVHYGVVRAVHEHIMVESKSGQTFPTYLHPLNVIDPTYLILAPQMRVHFFRRASLRHGSIDLDRLASKYRAKLHRLMSEFQPT